MNLEMYNFVRALNAAKIRYFNDVFKLINNGQFLADSLARCYNLASEGLSSGTIYDTTRSGYGN